MDPFKRFRFIKEIEVTGLHVLFLLIYNINIYGVVGGALTVFLFLYAISGKSSDSSKIE